MLLCRYKVIASAVGQAVWAVTPSDPDPPTDDVDYLLDFEIMDYVGDTQPDAMDNIINWVEALVSIIKRLTTSLHVSLQVGCSAVAFG